MGNLDRVSDALIGLVPTAGASCARCGTLTRALANGRGRVDLCLGCGSVDVRTAEGLDLLSLRGTPVAAAPLRARDPWRLR